MPDTRLPEGLVDRAVTEVARDGMLPLDTAVALMDCGAVMRAVEEQLLNAAHAAEGEYGG